MTDRRFLASNGRVAHEDLRGKVDAPEFVQGSIERVLWPLVDLVRAPWGARDKQLMMGQPVWVLERHEGWAFVQDAVDDYVGYVPEEMVGKASTPTHRVGVPLAHVYSEPDMKSPECGHLTFFAEIAVREVEGGFLALKRDGGGYVAAQHLVRLGWYADDAVTVAEMFLGTPYLWGGNSAFGVDCSGLVQLAWHAKGWACPRDSDLQEAELGRAVERDAPLRRGDLVFWKGHVGIMRDAETLLHANAHHMAVASEPACEAMDRIATKEFGEVRAIKRMGGHDE